MAATLIELIRGQNLEQLQQAKQNRAILENFERNCHAMEEDGHIKDQALNEEFREKLEILLAIYENSDPNILNRLRNIQRQFQIEDLKFDTLGDLMSNQIKKMPALNYSGFISRLFTPDQEMLSIEVNMARGQLDALYERFIPEKILNILAALNRAVLHVVNDDSRALGDKIVYIVSLYARYHHKLSLAIENALYSSKVAGMVCTIEDILLKIGDSTKSLKDYIQECYPQQKEDNKKPIVQSYLGACYQYINKKLGYGIAGNKHEASLQYLINIITNIFMLSDSNKDVQDIIINKVILYLQYELDGCMDALGKMLGEDRRNLDVCKKAFQKIERKFMPSAKDKLMASFKSKGIDSSEEAIIEEVPKIREHIAKAEKLQEDINSFQQIPESAASKPMVSAPQHSAPARIAPAGIAPVGASSTSTVSVSSPGFREYRSTESAIGSGKQTRSSFFIARNRLPLPPGLGCSVSESVAAGSVSYSPEEGALSSSSAANLGGANVREASAVSGSSAVMGSSMMLLGSPSSNSTIVNSDITQGGGSKSEEESKAFGHGFLTPHRKSEASSSDTESEEEKKDLKYRF